jgi:hypothetical protein
VLQDPDANGNENVMSAFSFSVSKSDKAKKSPKYIWKSLDREMNTAKNFNFLALIIKV